MNCVEDKAVYCLFIIIYTGQTAMANSLFFFMFVIMITHLFLFQLYVLCYNLQKVRKQITSLTVC